MTSLPNELLSAICEMATYSPTRETKSLVDKPSFFESIDKERENAQISSSFATKRHLSMVCSRWKAISAPFLYESVIIKYGGSDLHLASALECSTRKLGRYVKRIFVSSSDPHPRTQPHDAKDTTQRILKACPNVLFVSFDNATGGFDEDDLDQLGCTYYYKLSLVGDHVQRLDIFNGHYTTNLIHRNASIELDVHCSYESLRVLSVHIDTIEQADSAYLYLTDSTISLPNLHTLHLSKTLNLIIKLQKVEMPSLQRLIVSNFTIWELNDLIDNTATHIRCFEISSLPACDYFSDNVSLLRHAVAMFENLEEIYLPLRLVEDQNHPRPWYSTAFQENGQHRYQKLQHIGVHGAHNHLLKARNGIMGRGALFGESKSNTIPKNYEEWSWARVRMILGQITGQPNTFPNLESISLYGSEWLDLVTDSQFSPILEEAMSSGIHIRGVDIEVERALQHYPRPEKVQARQDIE